MKVSTQKKQVVKRNVRSKNFTSKLHSPSRRKLQNQSPLRTSMQALERGDQSPLKRGASPSNGDTATSRRPTIMDRYAFSQGLLEIQRDSLRKKQKIQKKEQEMEKLAKYLKEKTNDLFELKQNDMIMRQDLSTYQSYLEETFNMADRAREID